MDHAFRRYRWAYLGIAFWLVTVAPASAQTAVREWSDKFAAALGSGGVPAATQMLVERFQADWRGTTNIPKVESMIAFLNAFAGKMGAAAGYERAGETWTGQSVVRLDYLLKLPDQVGVMQLWFYRPQDRLKISNFTLNIVEPHGAEAALSGKLQ